MTGYNHNNTGNTTKHNTDDTFTHNTDDTTQYKQHNTTLTLSLSNSLMVTTLVTITMVLSSLSYSHDI